MRNAVKLREAVERNNLLDAALCISAGANVNSTFKGVSLLELTIELGHSEMAELLIDNKASVHIRSSKDNTPLLMVAILKENITIARRMIAKGSDVNLSDGEGRTCLMAAVYTGNMEMIELLLSQNVNILPHPNSKGDALHLACLHGNLEVAQALLRAGLSFSHPDIYGHTAMEYAIESGNEDLVNLLNNTKTQQGYDAAVC